MMSDLYWYPKFDGKSMIFFRFGGPGLGNLLFPLSRALIGAEKTKGIFIEPIWMQLKIGPMLRRERDLRTYVGEFSREYAVDGKVSNFTKFSKCKKIKEDEYNNEITEGCIVVGGLRNYFDDLCGYRKLIRAEIDKRISVRKYKSSAELQGCIAMHVRLGDFGSVDANKLKAGGSNTRINLDWYAGVVHKMKSIYGKDVCFNLYSDGRDEELESLLRISGVNRRHAGSTINDLMEMGNHGALIASASTYSMWGGISGKCPDNLLSWANEI